MGTPTALIIDFLEWIAVAPRSYAEAMEAWRTSCPRLTIWEDAVDEGWVARRHVDGEGAIVELTARGRAHLEKAAATRAPTPGATELAWTPSSRAG